jgi:hypothetical protein
MAEEKLTKAGAVELEEDVLDQASGGVSKVEAITIKQTVSRDNIGSAVTGQPPEPV